MQEQTLAKKHTLSLEERENLLLTGVEDVPLFDEQTVSVMTAMGNLVIKGTSLHITKLSLDIKIKHLLSRCFNSNKDIISRL